MTKTEITTGTLELKSINALITEILGSQISGLAQSYMQLTHNQNAARVMYLSIKCSKTNKSRHQGHLVSRTSLDLY